MYAKLMGENIRNRIYAMSQISLHKVFINNKGKHNNTVVEDPGRYHLNQVVKVYIPSTEKCQHPVPPGVMH